MNTDTQTTEVDPFDTPEYQQFVEECAKDCRCSQKPCDGVLAGGPCDEIVDDPTEDPED